MIPSTEEIANMKALVQYSLSEQYIDKLLLRIIEDNYLCLQNEPLNHEYVKQILIAIQTFGELGLFWDASFEKILDDLPIDKNAFKAQINFQAMYLKATHKNIQQILRWYGCRKNFIPNKKELTGVIYEICHETPAKDTIYCFEEPKHCYMLYWISPYWLLYDCKKALTWHLSV